MKTANLLHDSLLEMDFHSKSIMYKRGTRWHCGRASDSVSRNPRSDPNRWHRIVYLDKEH